MTHGLPHLLVLHDLDTRISYWVHVTADAVESTGRGCKILVPAYQTIDEEHVDALYSVASKQKAAPAIEGSAFLGAPGGIPPARRLRFALIAPRLVAPHPSAGNQRGVNAVEAVALLAQARLRDLKRFAEKHPSVPDPQNFNPGGAWAWQFVAAIWDWEMTDSIDCLTDAFAAAPSKEATAASGVLLACALQRLEQHGRALAVLDDLVDGDALLPADHGWALVQRARIRAETGDVSGARDDATAAQRCFAGDEADITVSALAAAAAWQLFATADRRTSDRDRTAGEFSEMVTASDTAVSWWRSQTVSWGLNRAETEWFQSWAEDRSHTVAQAGGPGAFHLFAAEFSADLTGEQASWRALCALEGRQRLRGAAASRDEVAELVHGLDALRRSGDHRSLKLAIERLYRDGPIEAVVEAVNKIRLDGWTHTTALATLEAMALAGDLVSEQSANDFLPRYAVLVYGDLSEFMEKIRPTFHVPYYAFRAVIGLLPACDTWAHNQITELIAAESDPARGLPSDELARAVTHLDFDSVAPSGRAALWDLAQRDQGQLGAAVLGWLAANDHPGARGAVTNRAADGDLDALAAMGDVAALEATEADTLINQLDEMVQQTTTLARRGSYTLGGSGAEFWLTRLNLAFPEQARWHNLIELLCEPAVAWHDKRSACLLLAELSTRLPGGLRRTLIANIGDIATVAQGVGGESLIGGVDTVLAIALGVLERDDADVAAAELARGSPQERRDIARLLGSGTCPTQQPILSALIGDPHSDVRHEATVAVGRLAATGPNKSTRQLAGELARKDGAWLPSALLAGFSYGNPPLPEFVADIARDLQSHASGRVRRSARHLLR